ncbi:MAG: ABC transporter ATP-binding protein [Proteobacteria bacterium]|nr:MAG: ABC transporter ATP-binding protein [Pseudomonadota bacterium]
MIRAEALTKSFQRTRVLDALDLAVEDGERVALVGANGAGKTTLIRCLLGEYTYEGRLAVGGREPRGARTEVLRRTGFVPQLPPPLRMPVGGLLAFAAAVCGERTGPMEAVATRLGLDARALWKRPFGKLSGGQKQKLLIAIALGRACDLLVLDEPAANLDPQARRAFFALLAERPHATMLISSHRIDEVAQLVSRVIELDRGKVVLDDRVAGTAALDAVLRCRVELVQPSPAAAGALASWGFAASGDGRVFEGAIAGPDRLRFLGAIARYAGQLRVLALEEERRS